MLLGAAIARCPRSCGSGTWLEVSSWEGKEIVAVRVGLDCKNFESDPSPLPL